MVPPRFEGPTQPCPRCGREVRVVTLPPELRIEGAPVPGEDGRWRLIPVLGEAT
jgi:hypothetical protein